MVIAKSLTNGTTAPYFQLEQHVTANHGSALYLHLYTPTKYNIIKTANVV